MNRGSVSARARFPRRYRVRVTVPGGHGNTRPSRRFFFVCVSRSCPFVTHTHTHRDRPADRDLVCGVSFGKREDK